MTNFEKIMQSTEELTKFFNMDMKKFCSNKNCNLKYSKDESVCFMCIIEWLNEEAKETEE